MLCCFNLDCTHFARVTLHIRFPMEPSSEEGFARAKRTFRNYW